MPVNAVEQIITGPAWHQRTFRVWYDSQTFKDVDIGGDIRSLLPGNERDDPAKVSATASLWLQMHIDDGPTGAPARTLLTDLPPDDPDRTDDPAVTEGSTVRFHGRRHPAHDLGQGQNVREVWRPVAADDPDSPGNPYGGVATHMCERPFEVEIIWDVAAGEITIATWAIPRTLF